MQLGSHLCGCSTCGDQKVNRTPVDVAFDLEYVRDCFMSAEKTSDGTWTATTNEDDTTLIFSDSEMRAVVRCFHIQGAENLAYLMDFDPAIHNRVFFDASIGEVILPDGYSAPAPSFE